MVKLLAVALAAATLSIQTAPVFVPLLAPVRYKGARGGRGSGKSHQFAEMLVEDHLREPGLRSVCIRETQISLGQSSKRLVEDKIAEFGVSHRFRILNTHIETPGGGIIIFVGMQAHNSNSIKSLEKFGRAWVEEAQSLSARSFELLRPTIRTPGSEMWFSWNPESPSDPVDSFFSENAKDPDVVCVTANYYDNPWFPDELRKEMERDRARDIDKYRHVWGGQYAVLSDSRVFKHLSIREFDTPRDSEFLYGADWGFAVDPTTLTRSFIIDDNLFIDYEAWAVGVRIEDTPELFDTVPRAREHVITADSARPEMIDYMRRHGYGHIRPAKKGPDSVIEGIKFLQDKNIIIHPRCVHAAEEFGGYVHKRHRLTNNILPDIIEVNDHTIDATRYATEDVRTPVMGLTW